MEKSSVDMSATSWTNYNQGILLMGVKLQMAACSLICHEIMGGGHHEVGGGAHSRSSSTGSSNGNSNHPLNFPSSSAASPSSSSSPARKYLSTDLKLGFSTPSQRLDWPPIKPLLRSTLAEIKASAHGHVPHGSLFVKVYMEGIPIGRKLDLFAQDGYKALTTTLRHMFRTTILCPGDHDPRVYHNSERHNCVLTYEDKEGDWMMVGDVPWEMFLTTVKRLKITRSDRC